MKTELVSLSEETLESVTGGLRWEGYRQSNNVIDLRTPINSTGAFARYDRSLDRMNEVWGRFDGGGGGGGGSSLFTCMAE